MIHEADSDRFARPLERDGETDVLLARGRIASHVVVTDDEGGRIRPQASGEDLLRAGIHRVRGSTEDLARLEEFLIGIEQQDDHGFLLGGKVRAKLHESVGAAKNEHAGSVNASTEKAQP